MAVGRLESGFGNTVGPKAGRLEYDVVDVFTNRAFAGNPLAVVYGADRLSGQQMQALATEFNLSETTFPVAPADSGTDYRLRIFTPDVEVPFAGHPTLGSAWALHARGAIPGGRVTQACGAGMIGVSLGSDSLAPVELSALPRDAARRLSSTEVATAARLVGLTEDDTSGPGYVAGCGLTWVYLRVTAGGLSRARPGGTRLDEVALDRSGLRDPLDGIDTYTVDIGGSARRDELLVRSRVFIPGSAISEDPGTGSAAVGLGLALVAAGLAVGDGHTSYRIEQGVEMGRPSVLSARVEAAHGVATRAHVGGQVVLVASGTIAVPEPS